MLVHATTPAERSRVVELGLDATPRMTSKGLQVILYGRRDARTLRDAGFTWTVLDGDLEASARADARADRAYARSVRAPRLPSGQDRYRRLAGYNKDMRELHQRFPNTTRLLTLKHRTVEGRALHGIEIATGAAKSSTASGVPADGRDGQGVAPGKKAIEYAYDLLQNFRRPAGDPRAERIVRATRTIVVPIINPDGFAISPALSGSATSPSSTTR